MNSRKTINELYVEANLSPTGVNLCAFKERSAVNAVSIITEQLWEASVKSLMEQVHLRCNMPSYQTCITDLFRANGFVPDNKRGRLGDLLMLLNDSGIDESYLLF